MRITVDFETRSAITDLPKTGPWPYAEHPSTDIICLALKVEDCPPSIWFPPKFLALLPENHGLPSCPDQAILDLIPRAEVIEAHNVQFELAVWHCVMSPRYGFPALPLERLRDSAAVAAMHALPRKLADACHVMGLAEQKDAEGYLLMRKMCKPRRPRKDEREAMLPRIKPLEDAYAAASTDKIGAMCAVAASDWPRWKDSILWNEEPSDLARLGCYCLQDVNAERALSRRLGDLPPYEVPVFQHDLVVNSRGVGVDVQMAQAAIDKIAEHERRLLGEVELITSGLARTPKQTAKCLEWLAAQGASLPNLQKETVVEALKAKDLPASARSFLEIRQSLSQSSTAKYSAAVAMACTDWRIRGFAMYHGAVPGRWAGKGIQLHNLPRGVFNLEREEGVAAFLRAVDLVKNGSLDDLIIEFGDPMPVLSSTIRPLLVPAPGNELLCADFSAIEGRALAWLAGEQWVLDAYAAYDRGEGPDLYMVTAGKVLCKPATEVTKSERKNPGKIADLACGYFGGPGAIAKFCGQCPDADRPKWILHLLHSRLAEEDTQGHQDLDKYAEGADEEKLRALEAYGWEIPTEEELFESWARDVVTKWRAARPETKALWFGLEAAAVKTLETGAQTTYKRITYAMDRGMLTAVLPSGRAIYYPFPLLVNQRMPWGDTKVQVSHMTVDAETKQWVRRTAHGGILTENVTQAVARDILAEALLRVEAAGFPPVIHVHDEIVSEVTKHTRRLEDFIAVMSQVPPWAHGLPISAAGWSGDRYKKD